MYIRVTKHTALITNFYTVTTNIYMMIYNNTRLQVDNIITVQTPKITDATSKYLGTDCEQTAVDV